MDSKRGCWNLSSVEPQAQQAEKVGTQLEYGGHVPRRWTMTIDGARFFSFLVMVWRPCLRTVTLRVGSRIGDRSSNIAQDVFLDPSCAVDKYRQPLVKQSSKDPCPSHRH
jgi:hypothetical protein